jgi:hypothetical protein
MEIPGSGTEATIFDFTTYLSNNVKMNDNHINMMFAHLGECVEQDDTLDAINTLHSPPIPCGFLRIPCSFLDFLWTPCSFPSIPFHS